MQPRKHIERRTFRQDRFEILIKRQKNGTATFNELTELDELVNRDPELRERVIRENILMEEPSVNTDDAPPAPEKSNEIIPATPVSMSAWEKLKTFFGRIFTQLTKTSLPDYRVNLI